MTKLYPPIEAIEGTLFLPSDELMERWVNGDESLSEEIREALEADAVAREKSDALKDSTEFPADEEPTGDLESVAIEPRVSPLLSEMIEKRVATREKFAEVVDLEPGQIRLVDRAVGPDGVDLEWDMNQPLAVLLLRETEEPGIWYGWMMGRETDYAGYWDVLLEEEDEPYDPFVSMVQLWNPVNIYVKSLGGTLGQLSKSRLATLASAFGDLLTGKGPDPAFTRPGALVDRLTSTDARCLTGTPIGEDNDPRSHYQQLYFAAAGMVKDQAELAIRALAENPELKPESLVERAFSVAQSLSNSFKETLAELAQELGTTLQVKDFVAAQGPEKEEAADIRVNWWEIPNLFTCAVIPDEDGHSVRVILKHVAGSDLTIRLIQDGELLQELRLDAGSSERTIFFEPDEGMELEFEDASGKKRTWVLSP